jgi:MFS family permease
MTSNILKLNIFSALKMMLFPMAIITLFWKDQIGLSLTEILLVNVFFSAANVIMEYPSGYVSDRLGYRLALIVACLFGIAGWSAYLVAHTFWHVTAPLLPFIVQIGVWGTALVVALSLHEPKAEKGPLISSHLKEAVRISRYALVEKGVLRSTMLFGMLLGLASFYPVWLVQPFMQQCQVPLTWFGPVWAGANLTVALCAYHSHTMLKALGLRRMCLLFFVLIVGAYAGLGLTSALGSFLFYYLLTAMRGFQGPMLRSLLQHNCTRQMRASILSLHNLLFRLGFVVSGPLIGSLSDAKGLNTAFLVLAGAFALLLPLAARSFLHHQAGAEHQTDL